MNAGCSLSIYIQTNINMGSTHVDVLILLIKMLFSFPGELIGIDYLYMQTGKCMQDMDPEGEETEQLLEDLGDEAEDEGFTDDTEASLELFSALISLPPAQPSTSGSWSAAPPPPSPPPAQPSTSGSWSAAPPPPSPPPPPPASSAVTAPGAAPQVPVEQLVSTFEQ